MRDTAAGVLVVVPLLGLAWLSWWLLQKLLCYWHTPHPGLCHQIGPKGVWSLINVADRRTGWVQQAGWNPRISIDLKISQWWDVTAVYSILRGQFKVELFWHLGKWWIVVEVKWNDHCGYLFFFVPEVHIPGWQSNVGFVYRFKLDFKNGIFLFLFSVLAVALKMTTTRKRLPWSTRLTSKCFLADLSKSVRLCLW